MRGRLFRGRVLAGDDGRPCAGSADRTAAPAATVSASLLAGGLDGVGRDAVRVPLDPQPRPWGPRRHVTSAGDERGVTQRWRCVCQRVRGGR